MEAITAKIGRRVFGIGFCTLVFLHKSSKTGHQPASGKLITRGRGCQTAVSAGSPSDLESVGAGAALLR